MPASSRALRPRTGHYRDVAEMAAALFESLAMNHPFADGNKRVAFFATDVFLRLNGCYLRVRGPTAHRFIVGLLETGTCDFAHLLPWIRRTLRRTCGKRTRRALGPRRGRGEATHEQGRVAWSPPRSEARRDRLLGRRRVAGDGNPKDVRFPDPAAEAEREKSVPLLPLERFLELTLASGLSAPHRLQDLAGVLALIRTLDIEESMAERPAPSVRAKYRELWRASRDAESR